MPESCSAGGSLKLHEVRSKASPKAASITTWARGLQYCLHSCCRDIQAGREGMADTAAWQGGPWCAFREYSWAYKAMPAIRCAAAQAGHLFALWQACKSHVLVRYGDSELLSGCGLLRPGLMDHTPQPHADEALHPLGDPICSTQLQEQPRLTVYPKMAYRMPKKTFLEMSSLQQADQSQSCWFCHGWADVGCP